MHTAAREMVYVAEQGLLADKNTVDSTWQEMLNHATTKVPHWAQTVGGLLVQADMFNVLYQIQLIVHEFIAWLKPLSLLEKPFTQRPTKTRQTG